MLSEWFAMVVMMCLTIFMLYLVHAAAAVVILYRAMRKHEIRYRDVVSSVEVVVC